MKEFYISKDKDNKLHICSTDDAAVDWEKSRGREIIGKIETDLDILELKRYVSGTQKG